jgi:hypothetical protein
MTRCTTWETSNAGSLFCAIETMGSPDASGIGRHRVRYLRDMPPIVRLKQVTDNSRRLLIRMGQLAKHRRAKGSHVLAQASWSERYAWGHCLEAKVRAS